MAKRRDESFFGMHFDFHAGPDQKNIGDYCDYEALEELLEAVKPDYVQCDTKGHPGASSYPTKKGIPAPEMKGDLLKMWREATLKYGVALYAHHSGILDAAAAKAHPEWARGHEDGTPDKSAMSVYGPYCEEFLLPQLLELANDYKLDGAWVDGECWAAAPDYSKWAADEYKMRFSAEPPKHDEPDYYNYLRFNRQGFRDYVDRYVRGLHKFAPDFQVTSNWLYTSFMPEPPEIHVNFLSGDYSPTDSVNAARFEGRCLMNQMEPWDLMSWGFSTGDSGHCVKEYEQLCQEAAAVIMLGGGFQIYNRQLVGTIQKRCIPMWAELAKFCREREELCHNAEAIPQIGVIYSRKAKYHDTIPLFTNGGGYLDELRGTLLCLLDAGFSTETLMTHQALGRELSGYAALVVTDLKIIESDLRAALLDYADKGGTLIICGYDSAQLFLPYLDVDITGGSDKPVSIYLKQDGRSAPLLSPCREIKLGEGAAPLGFFDYSDGNAEGVHIAASSAPYGDGKICGVYYDPGTYLRSKSAAARDFMRSMINSVCAPTVRLVTNEPVEMAVMTKDGQTRINLLNLNGAHDALNTRSFDRVSPVYGVTVELDTAKAPSSVKLLPSGAELKPEYDGKTLRVTIPELHIHEVLCIDS